MAAVTALHDSMGRLAGSRASQNYEQLQRHSSSADTSDIFTCMNLLVLSLHSPMRNNSPAPTKPAQVVFASSPPLSPRVGDPWTEDEELENLLIPMDNSQGATEQNPLLIALPDNILLFTRGSSLGGLLQPLLRCCLRVVRLGYYSSQCFSQTALHSVRFRMHQK